MSVPRKPFLNPLILCASVALLVAKSSSAPVDYARDIQPILEKNCYSCHGPAKHKGGLRLDRPSDALAGGDSGKVIIPGNSASSPLIQFVRGDDPDKIMPPKGDHLKPEQISKLRDWIDGGAKWPVDALAESAPRSKHWAFQAPTVPALPRIKSSSRNPIDFFVQARLVKEKLSPSPLADRATLIRRISLDLLGLLPTADVVAAFVQDQRPEAYERLVDSLLSSPHFGERWGRHWLDLARYADSDGYEKDNARPYAYTFRDWVINAINRDLPFDQFTIEQLAGDLLPDATEEQRVATGFHRQTLTNREGGVDQEEFRCKATVDRANTTASVWLGLTLGCAECHTHKYDPITQREYYQFYAFFNNASEKDIPIPKPAEKAEFDQKLKSWDTTIRETEAALQTHLQDLFQLSANSGESFILPELPSLLTGILRKSPSARTAPQQKELDEYFTTLTDDESKQLHARLTRAHGKKPKLTPTTAATVVADSRKTQIHIRGDFLRKGDPVEPGTLAVLPALHARSEKPDRLDLARWLVSRENPLTARVTVNHVWKQLFGRALVASVNDFGSRGEQPSHPELLDWLAITFASPKSEGGLGWSRKALIKLLVTSHTYQQSSGVRPELAAQDPNNVLLARQARYRLEAENVRDVYLCASGLLNPEIGGPSIRPQLPADIAALGYANSVRWDESKGDQKYRRGLYIFFQRTVPYPMLMTFDAPDSNTTCTRRERSNTPLQALTLLNDPVFFECARALGERTDGPGLSPNEKIRAAFRVCLSRDPEEGELKRLLALYDQQLRALEAEPRNAGKILSAEKSDQPNPGKAAMVALCRVLLNLDEFVTRE